MHYTSGTTGRPKGVKRGLFEIDPSDMGELMAYCPSLFGIEARDGHVHLTVLAALPHGRADVDGQRPAHGPHRGAHGQVDAPRRCCA